MLSNLPPTLIAATAAATVLVIGGLALLHPKIPNRKANCCLALGSLALAAVNVHDQRLLHTAVDAALALGFGITAWRRP